MFSKTPSYTLIIRLDIRKGVLFTNIITDNNILCGTEHFKLIGLFVDSMTFFSQSSIL
jgi:hypothetical protein